MTREDRTLVVTAMLGANRRAAMSGEEPPFNNEAMLTLLVAPESFLDAQSKLWERLESMLPSMSFEDWWAEIRADIERLFPGQFTEEQLGDKP